jgi:putative Holliday junction resolvase
MPEQPQTLLGFDFGLRRIGVAVGQTLTRTANPLETIACVRGSPDWERIALLVQEWRPDSLVVGIPNHADATPHSLQPAIEGFMRQLEQRYKLPVHTIDERLSSVEGAQRQRATEDNGPGLDAYAAQAILESFLAVN